MDRSGWRRFFAPDSSEFCPDAPHRSGNSSFLTQKIVGQSYPATFSNSL
jgi:hypothetical protein